MSKQNNQRLPLIHLDIPEQVQQSHLFFRGNTADLIHSLMINSNSKAIYQTSLKVMKALQNECVENQILGLSSLFLTFMDRYGLNYIDVLGMADSIVFSGESNNMLPEFKTMTRLMKNKKEF